MDTYNLFEAPELQDSDESDPEGFRGRYARIGQLLGGKRIGATLYDLAPGERICPYHYEYNNEEWLLVVRGRPTLRTPSGVRELREGDVVVFPEGPDGAHDVKNDTDERLQVVMLSTKNKPDVSVYPDSDKIGVWPVDGGGPDHLIVKRESNVDYWEGEL
jgi:uncharacterized cupin superfamily protein